MQLTISLADDVGTALRAQATRSGRTVDELVGEALRRSAILETGRVAAILEQAAANANLSEDEALRLGLAEVAAVRTAKLAAPR